jgi:hypothetical protein
MPSVTVALYGGLGNQLFQYAMGRALSLRHGITLNLDLYGFAIDRRYRRRFELEHFDLPSEVGKVRRPAVFRLSWMLSRLAAVRREVASLARPWLVLEAGPEFDERSLVLDPGRDSYVLGYWQDERYFSQFGEAIRRDLTLAHTLSKANQEIASWIRSVNSVAIHARRLHATRARPGAGAQPTASQGALSLGVEYYRRAMGTVTSRVEDPHFMVFSDHPQWARENLAFGTRTTFFDNDRGPAHEDMVLMSLCRHHVIANSSFSWWGAWLARTDDHLVIAPEGVKHTPNKPESWTSLGAV